MKTKSLILHEQVVNCIHLIRGQRVILDSDLANLYGVQTKVLLQAVRRNQERFPRDFKFQLKYQDVMVLRSQVVTSNKGKGGRRYLPYVFTEQGVAMLSSVLRSKKAVQVNIQIMRAFVQMRQILFSHKNLFKKIESLEKKYQNHDQEIQTIFEVIKKMMAFPNKKQNKIGFMRE